MNNKYNFPVGIIEICKIYAKNNGTSLDEELEKYYKLLEENRKKAKKANEALKIIKEIMNEKNIDCENLIKKAFEHAKIEIPIYTTFKANFSLGYIKKGEEISFNLKKIENLKDRKIYLLEHQEDKTYCFGEYNKKEDCFYLSSDPIIRIKEYKNIFNIIGTFACIVKNL